VHGTQADRVSDSYRRYLANFFRDRFDLYGTPVRVEMRAGENPYKDRRNPLTNRQQERRRRLMRHAKKKKRR
jgi:GTP-binding protein